MCGIAGIWLASPGRKEEIADGVDRMLSTLIHRGPDDGGYAANERVALGNRRLSIFDLSEAGRQPFFSADGSVWLVFNGEIYNHLELRKELESEFRFVSGTDTEVLLHAYEKWGINCLSRFIGMYAIAIWDARQQALILCRDRIGIKPLYYSCEGKNIYFASEIKALFAAGVSRDVNNRALRDYLVEGFYDHTEDTFFKGVHQVRQGCYLEVSDSGIKEKCYWDLKGIILNQSSRSDAENEYWYLLEDAVRLRMRADVPYAVMLSGGLDSSALAHLASKNTGGRPLNVCTFRHTDPRYDEGPWADLVAKDRGWLHHDIVLAESHVSDLLPCALWHQEEPFGSVATFADILLAEKARENGIYVLLEGQGGDETLAGYEYYYSYYLADLAEENIDQARTLHGEYAFLRGIKGGLIEGSFLDMLERGARIAGGVGQDGTASVMQSVLSPELLGAKGTGWGFESLGGSRLNTTLLRDLTRTKVPRVLRFKDKASMMLGVELRVPYLDHRLVELSFQIPAQRKLARGYTKYCLRERMAGLLPQETCYHVKRHIQTPQKDWLRGILKPMVAEVIHSQSFAQRGIFDIAKVKEAYREFLISPTRYQNIFFIWQWLQLEWWFRIFFDESVDCKVSLEWADPVNHRRSPEGVATA